MSLTIAKGLPFPEDIKFLYIPSDANTSNAAICGIPTQLDVSKEVADKKVVLVAAPGAFTPSCTESHIPQFGAELASLKKKGVDKVIVFTANDPFVVSAWGKVLNLNKEIIFASDPLASFSKSLGLTYQTESLGLGLRSDRYVIIVDHGKVTYFAAEEDPILVEVTSVEEVLHHL